MCEKVKLKEAASQESGENEPGSSFQRNGDEYRKERIVRFSDRSGCVVQ